MTSTAWRALTLVALPGALAAASMAWSASATPPWTWPLDASGAPPTILEPYDPPAHPWSAGNRGVDLAASAGQAVRSPSAGTVVFVGQVAGIPVMVVRSPGGLRSTLEPVEPGGDVVVGTLVRAGQAIGVVATAPPRCGPRACLHWGVRTGRGHATRYRDPIALLRGGGAPVLLPLDGGAGLSWRP